MQNCKLKIENSLPGRKKAYLAANSGFDDNLRGFLARGEISEFCFKVYSFVRTIPKGKTATYKEVAVAIGCPKAYRAVGNALNRNPCPYFSKQDTELQDFVGKIPCHRVICSNGNIGGYVLGTNKKLELLLSEKVKLHGLMAVASLDAAP